MPAAGPERISKILANRGVCSRREADDFIRRGLVLLDGKPVHELGTKALPGQDVRLAASAQRQQAGTATILVNKPVGYVAAQPEKNYKPASDLIRPDRQEKAPGDPPLRSEHLRGLAPAGRLDIDSKGLMVFTQDGRIAKQLVGPEHGIEKEYLVRVEGKLDTPGLNRLRQGIRDGAELLRAERVEWVNADQLRVILKEGRKRQIRRMCDAVGVKVMGLKRVRIGQVKLGNLPEGHWRFLRAWERF